MKICPNCHYQNREGYLFCEDCGEDLTRVPSTQTRLFAAPESDEPAITLQVQGIAKPIPLKLGTQTVLGRYDADRSQQPDIDLSAYEALEKGVSALHAAVQHTAEGVQVIDMGSTNGTYINGRRLAPNQYYILHDGDEIRLSRLVARILISGIPA